MVDQRAQDAVSRIERALARIEAAAQRPAPAPPGVPSEDFERLREAHDALRRQVIGAIGQLDDLIAVGERV
jgi:chromosome segregation ATPase